jgi:hypothetical protein
MSNSKNILQEYYQKHNLSMPKYISVQDPVSLLWSSTVTFTNPKGEEVTVTSSQERKKTDSTISAAGMALKMLDGITEPKEPKDQQSYLPLGSNFSTNTATCTVLVDYENVHTLDRLVSNKNVDVIKFVSMCNPRTSSADFVIKSIGSDAVDHFISVYLGCLWMKYEHKEHNVIVLTRDRFAGNLLNFFSPDQGFKVHHVTNEKDCLNLIDSIANTQHGS